MSQCVCELFLSSSDAVAGCSKLKNQGERADLKSTIEIQMPQQEELNSIDHFRREAEGDPAEIILIT